MARCPVALLTPARARALAHCRSVAAGWPDPDAMRAIDSLLASRVVGTTQRFHLDRSNSTEAQRMTGSELVGWLSTKRVEQQLDDNPGGGA